MSTETTTAVTKTRETSVLMRMAERFGMEPKAFESVIRATVMPGGVSDAHFCAFLLVAHEYELNPLTRQIYAFPGKGGGIVPIVSVDGWHFLANTHKQYDGMAQKVVRDEQLGQGIETTIWRKDRSHPMVHIEWLNECKRDTDPWKQMPQRMLGHRSFVQSCRMAFNLSGIYDEDEALDIIDTTATVSAPKALKPSRVAQLEARIAGDEQVSPETAAAIERGLADAKAGRLVPDEQVRPELYPPEKQIITPGRLGKQSSLLDLEGLGKQLKPAPVTLTKDGPIATDDADEEGYEAVLALAYEEGQGVPDGTPCPHPKGSDIEAAWVAGYNSGHKDGLF